jgi:hypothetical protein
METYDLLEIGPDDEVTINGEVQPETVRPDDVRGGGAGPHCEYCGGRTDSELWERPDADEDWEAWHGWKWSIIVSCEYCRSWRWSRSEGIRQEGYTDLPPVYELHCVSKLRQFDGTLPDSLNTELAGYLRRHRDGWNQFSPAALERIVTDILRANFRDAEVVHVGRPDDGGVDVLFVDAEGPEWLVQVKRRLDPGGAEGVGTLRNLLGAMVIERSLRGLIVSTADRFSTRARAAADDAKQLGYEIRLADRGILDRMLEPVLPVMPWLDVMKGLDGEVAQEYSPEFISREQLSFFEEPIWGCPVPSLSWIELAPSARRGRRGGKIGR